MKTKQERMKIKIETNLSKEEKFLVDSGATEHLTNCRLIFKIFDEHERGLIKCANKEAQADLKSEGVGSLVIWE